MLDEPGFGIEALKTQEDVLNEDRSMSKSLPQVNSCMFYPKHVCPFPKSKVVSYGPKEV